MRQHDISRVELSWLSLDFKEGYAPGSTIQEARSAPNWMYRPTGMGRIHRAYNPDKSGTITVSVMQLSLLHADLTRLAETDAELHNIVGPMVLHDAVAGFSILFSNTFILTDPDEARETDLREFPWVFVYESRKKILPPNGPLTAVGV